MSTEQSNTGEDQGESYQDDIHSGSSGQSGAVSEGSTATHRSTKKMAGRKLTPEESRALFEKHETWCEVERTKEEAWCRKRRKHYKRHLVSHVFDHMLNKEEEPEPRVPFGIDEALHLQRRHFPPKHLVSKWTVL